MEFIPELAHVALPLLGKLFGGGMSGPMLTEVGGRRRRMRRRNGKGVAMIGGRKCKGTGRRGRRRGRGFFDTIKKVGKRIAHYGNQAYKLYNNKNVRGLVKHGLNVYNSLNEGKGRRRRMRQKIRMINRGRGMDNLPPGPLP